MLIKSHEPSEKTKMTSSGGILKLFIRLSAYGPNRSSTDTEGIVAVNQVELIIVANDEG